MTSERHPITPPLELVQQWRDLPEYTDGRRKMVMVTLSREKLLDIATQAARWGSDQELEACCEWLSTYGHTYEIDLRANRRPKPPSPKEEALKVLEALIEWQRIDYPGYQALRHALEQLND